MDKTPYISDSELVQMVLVDQENFGLIIEKFEKKLLGYLAFFMGVRRAQAEDVFQETMIKVYRSLNGYNPKLSLSSWIFRIAHNEAVNFLKKHSNQVAISLEEEDEEGSALIKILSSDENVIERVADAQTVEQVGKVLSMMRPEFREILILRFVKDLDYLEIADILKKPIGSIGVIIQRAKDEFKKIAIKNNLISYE